MASKYQRIKQVLTGLKQPDYRYRQIMDAIFTRRIGEFEKMSMLPTPLRNALVDQFGSAVCGIRPITETSAKQVGKVLFEMADGRRIETVGLRYKRGWESFCVSSQCGCGFGCRFCTTGALGFQRNLTADEITDQLLYFHLNRHPLSSVSFMGMGEALANPHIYDALAILTDPQLFGLSQRRITISTIGVPSGIRLLTRSFPQVNLTFSLHSPFDEERSAIMPVNKRFPLQEVMNVLDRHAQRTGRKIFIAYILLDGINDTPEHAGAIAGLLRGRDRWERLYNVDLIAYNPTDKTPQKFRQTSHYKTKRFMEHLRAEGLQVTVRTQFGSNIDAACGQLYGKSI
ncbi:23S rRNA (adenine-C8)-methyltransferase [Sporobacter termitidis DSM 10068]|uniref:23S rRNA (Adenine-C8)-methyltransferase n=1 Tax=Sporobacter termitidis DSM 10068 TaxID=1123282 RepID=A0A1M5TC53_9FIRM|nr:23S rRNA (adenine(2503)-C(8))-methyltransferase Cfr [Sporobacter termitidis]SHH48298.1 23S rRNA (adenine-C8)-methyltransferase [Sporobacter termitidis DSM 10068]